MDPLLVLAVVVVAAAVVAVVVVVDVVVVCYEFAPASFLSECFVVAALEVACFVAVVRQDDGDDAAAAVAVAAF